MVPQHPHRVDTVPGMRRQQADTALLRQPAATVLSQLLPLQADTARRLPQRADTGDSTAIQAWRC